MSLNLLQEQQQQQPPSLEQQTPPVFSVLFLDIQFTKVVDWNITYTRPMELAYMSEKIQYNQNDLKVEIVNQDNSESGSRKKTLYGYYVNTLNPVYDSQLPRKTKYRIREHGHFWNQNCVKSCINKYYKEFNMMPSFDIVRQYFNRYNSEKKFTNLNEFPNYQFLDHQNILDVDVCSEIRKLCDGHEIIYVRGVQKIKYLVEQLQINPVKISQCEDNFPPGLPKCRFHFKPVQRGANQEERSFNRCAFSNTIFLYESFQKSFDKLRFENHVPFDLDLLINTINRDTRDSFAILQNAGIDVDTDTDKQEDPQLEQLDPDVNMDCDYFADDPYTISDDLDVLVI